jgi:hypothetical protein
MLPPRTILKTTHELSVRSICQAAVALAHAVAAIQWPARPAASVLRFRGVWGAVTCIAFTTFSAGCTAMKPVAGISSPVPPPAYGDIRVGDRVSVEMNDGRRESFRVEFLEGDAIVSPSGQRYPRKDMRRLERQHFSHAKTWPLVAGAVVGGILVLAALVVAGGVGLPSP